MPTYEYRCLQCLKDFEFQARMQDPVPKQGPNCTRGDCCLQKQLSRVFGQVAGKSTPPPAPAPSPVLKEPENPVHVCSKYCDHHKN